MTRSVRNPDTDGPGRCGNSASCCQQDGDRVLDAAMSGVLVDVVARDVGALETTVLPHPYLHLLTLAGTA